jgi:hypothetical protein
MSDVDTILDALVAEHGGAGNLSTVHLAIARNLAAVLAIAEHGTAADCVRNAEAISRLMMLLPLPAKPFPRIEVEFIERLSDDELRELDRLQAKVLGEAPTEVSEQMLDAAHPARRAFPAERADLRRVFALEDALNAARMALAMAEDRIRVLSEPPAAVPRAEPVAEPPAAAAKSATVVPLRTGGFHDHEASLANRPREDWQGFAGPSRFP